MDGVVKLIPVPNAVPPLAAAYQLKIPALAVAPRVSVPVSHRDAGVVAVIVGVELIVAITKVRGEVPQALVAST